MSVAEGTSDLYWTDQSLELCSLSAYLFGQEEFADVTLACNGGKTFTGHKLILAAASPVLRDKFRAIPANQGQE